MDYIDPDLARMDTPPPQGPFYTSANTITVTVLTGIVIILIVVPFRTLYVAKQLPACTMIAVTGLVLFFNFVNAILWPNDDITTWWDGNGLCDVEVLLKAVLSTLCASSTACLTHNLSQAVDVDNNPRLFESAAMRRRRIAGELLFCFGIPFVQLVTHYFVQAGRYAIIAVYGCIDVVDTSWVTNFLFAAWPLIFSLINCYYAILVMIRLRRHRGNLTTTLSSSGSSFTAHRFMKLFFLCMLFFILQLPATIAFFYFNVRNNIPFRAYSWSQIHDPTIWPLIIYFTTPDYPLLQYYGWPPLILGIGVFLFYGLNNEAIDRYRHIAIFCRLERIWPSLTQPREARRRGSDSRSSWATHLDFIGKAVRYFDDARKHSHSSTVTGSDMECSHKGSVTSTSTSTSPTTSTSSRTETPSNPHLSSPVESSSTTANTPTLSPAPPPLSGFRTYMHIPFALLPKKPSASRQNTHPHARSTHASGVDDDDDDDDNNRRHEVYPALHAGSGSGYVAPGVVQTTVSTGGCSSLAAGTSDGSGCACACGYGCEHEHEDEDEEKGAPRRGTRAYRERERRGLKQQRGDGELGGVTVEKSVDQSSSH